MELSDSLKKTAGVILIVLGVIGIAIPLFPDILFIIIGASLLGSEVVTKKIDLARRKVKRLFRKIVKN